MLHDHIELKQRRDLGDTINIYFDFFKQNLKPFLNIFISYNGIFIIGFLGISYLLVTGFVGMFNRSQLGVTDGAQELESAIYLGFGGLGFVLLFLITAILNYSLAASYMIQYEKNETPAVNKKKIRALISNNAGKIFVFILLLIVIYIGVFVVGLTISVVPFVGTIIYYLITLASTAWMGVSFMVMLNENREVTDALSEGFRLIKANFWKSILVNLVIGLLLGLLMLLVFMIPGVLIGIYAFHSIENGVDLASSAFAKVIWTLALSILLILYTFNQSLAQFVNGILYFSLHEETYNEKTRARIDQIGAGE
jgi:Na+-transporting methylmalonyl-CoA/oxaloacetate decarboxylase gamma subunit